MNNTLIQFTLLIPINNRLREFNFRKRNNDRYDCNTADERGDRHYFVLVNEGGAWSIQDALLPSWLKGSEPAIVQALIDHETR